MTKTGAQNAVTDDSFGMEAPITQVDDLALLNEKNMARFSKSREFKVLKEYMEGRIEFFQKYLPDGRPLKTNTVKPEDWIIANTVIGEFKNILQAYEQASEAVRNATK